MEILELNHIALHIRDLNASMRFYGEVLGLPPLARPNFPFGGAWYALGMQQELHLIVDEDMTEHERHHGHLALRVADAGAARQELEARNVRGLRGPAPRPDGALQVFFSDPDGHLIELLDTSSLQQGKG